MATRKKKTTKNNIRSTVKTNIRTFLADKTFHASFGVFLVFVGLFFFASFLSFLFSWKHDQSLLLLSVNTTEIIKYHNVLGKWGAILGQKFVYDWFGINALILAINIIALGARIGFKSHLFSLSKLFRNSLFWIIWLTLFFGLTQSGTHSVWSGGIGYSSANWMISLIGKAGFVLFLVFGMMIYLVVMFKVTPEQIKQLLQKFSKVKMPIKDNTLNEELTPVVEKAPEVIEFEEKEPVVEVPAPEVKMELDPVVEIELETETPAPQEKEETEDTELVVEEVAAEETLTKTELSQKVKDFGEYDPTLDLSKFKLPSIDLLVNYSDDDIKIDKNELEENKNRIVETLSNYKIGISKIKATVGPTVTLYEIIPEAGVRISKIKNLEDDIALSLSALGIRIIAPIPGKGTIGIEVPNANPNMISMKSVIQSDKFQSSKMELPIAFGKTISNETFVVDLAKMPHLLMAGATGQGKSVGLNAILASILYKKHPAQVKFVLVDPKKVELTLFNKIERHYLAKLPDTEEAIITDTSKVVNTLNSMCIEMDNRYELLKNAMVRNIKEYNAKFIQRKLNPEEGHKYLPYIVLVIDEFADLIMTAGKEVETPIARLAQLARAIGIHLIVATQRPSVNVITGIIKANFPARVAFRVTSKIDSRTILDAGGADQLIGKGDMLFTNGNEMTRLQCAFIDTPEVEKITDFIGSQRAYPEAYLLPEYVGEEGDGIGAIDKADRDVLFEDAAKVVVTHQQGSASLLQRKLKLGYNRAGRIVDQLEAAGIIGPFEGSKARQVLVPDFTALEQLLNNE